MHQDDDFNPYGRHSKLNKRNRNVDPKFIQDKVVEAISTSVKEKMKKGEFKNDFEGIFDEQSDNKYVILTCFDDDKLTQEY